MKTVFESDGCEASGCRFTGVGPGGTSTVLERSRRGETPTDCAAPTVIEVNVELGRGDAIFIRGQGGGLRWDKGRRLACLGAEHWRWSASGLREGIEFQLLLNDQVWARGKNRVLQAGEKIDVTPDFEWPEIPRTA